MIRHIFLDKCNTIIENSEYNTGLNPIVELNVGNILTRILLHFDISDIQNDVENGVLNTKTLKHVLKMTNCGNINLPAINDSIFSDYGIKKRASSFDIIAFRLPFEWDEGRGFDYNGDYVKETKKHTSVEGSNWYNAKTGVEWDEYGVYFQRTLMDDYNNNFGINDDGIVIGFQHFDNGSENLEIDITNYVNNILNKKYKNYGIGLAFSPIYENETLENKFVAFFSNHTNTFFNPYLEVINNDIVLDNRANFHLGFENKLYLFVNDNGEYVNLDKLPICTINDKTYEVKQSGKGIYYVDVLFKKNEIEPNVILTDIWSNLTLNGNELDDVEMEFLVLPTENKVVIGKPYVLEKKIYPQLHNINDCEKIKKGDVREVVIDFIEEYSYGTISIPTYAEYRIYVKEGEREIDVFDYHPIERKYDKHMFILNTNDFIPNTYYIDIKITQGRNIKHFNNVIQFTIVNNVTNIIK